MAAGAAAQGQTASKPRSILELRTYKMRNTLDQMPRRTTSYFEKSFVPMVKREGATAVGVFASMVAPDSPFLMTLTSWPSMAAWDESFAKASQDQEYLKQREAFHKDGLGYVRYEVTLMRGFPTFPGIEVPQAGSGGSRIYEIRVYESNNPVTLARKIRMFDEGEIDLFRKFGMVPVFFGQTIAGRNMPNLTYMVGFPSMGERDKIWGAFAGSPEWKKMSSQPGVSDAEVVSNISNYIVRPLAFSDIK